MNGNCENKKFKFFLSQIKKITKLVVNEQSIWKKNCIVILFYI